MRYPEHIPIAVALGSLVVLLALPLPTRAEQKVTPKLPERYALPLEMTPTSSRFVPIRGNVVTIHGDDGMPGRTVEVRLRRTWYDYRTVRVFRGRISGPAHPQKAMCLELVSDGAYRWAYFVGAGWPYPKGFALFTLDDGKTFLVWERGGSVRLFNVSRSRDRIVAFHDYHSGRAVPTGPPTASIGKLVPGGDRWGWLIAREYETEFVDLTKDDEGHLVLTVRDSYSGAAARLILRDGEWELLEHFAEGLPEEAGDEGEAAVPAPPATETEQRAESGAQRINEAYRRLEKAYYSNVDAPDPGQVFKENLPALRKHVRSPRVLTSSSMVDRRDCEAYRRIIAVGPRAVPHIVRQFLAEPESNTAVRSILSIAWMETSGFVTAPDFNPWYRTSVEEWWEGGQQLTDERFAQAYADDDLEAIRSLGVAALPGIMEKLEEGDHRMLNVVQGVTVGKANLAGETPAERAASCLTWWEANRKWWSIPFPDRREEGTARNQ
ncbi:MAG: hypothetical protein R6X33_18430 [Candidatus Brocadiia bacterium]